MLLQLVLVALMASMAVARAGIQIRHENIISSASTTTITSTITLTRSIYVTRSSESSRARKPKPSACKKFVTLTINPDGTTLAPDGTDLSRARKDVGLSDPMNDDVKPALEGVPAPLPSPQQSSGKETKSSLLNIDLVRPVGFADTSRLGINTLAVSSVETRPSNTILIASNVAATASPNLNPSTGKVHDVYTYSSSVPNHNQPAVSAVSQKSASLPDVGVVAVSQVVSASVSPAVLAHSPQIVSVASASVAPAVPAPVSQVVPASMAPAASVPVPQVVSASVRSVVPAPVPQVASASVAPVVPPAPASITYIPSPIPAPSSLPAANPQVPASMSVAQPAVVAASASVLANASNRAASALPSVASGQRDQVGAQPSATAANAVPVPSVSNANLFKPSGDWLQVPSSAPAPAPAPAASSSDVVVVVVQTVAVVPQQAKPTP